MGNGHDHDAVPNDPVNDPKREPPYRALRMHVIDGRESLRIGGNGGHGGIHGMYEAYRCSPAFFGVPIQRFFEVTAGTGR